MPINRRNFLAATGAAVTVAATQRVELASSHRDVKAVVFDAFPVFDPRPIAALAEELAPGKGAALSDVWRARLFDYQWLRALAGRYSDFHAIARESLQVATRTLSTDLDPAAFDRLVDAYARMKAWPDAFPALQALKATNVRLAFLSNMTEAMLRSNIRSAGLDALFDDVISTDRIRAYKPEPRAYQLACDVLHLDRRDILFVAFAGWDAAGARWFGLPTLWMNRANATPEFDITPTIPSGDFGTVLRMAGVK